MPAYESHRDASRYPGANLSEDRKDQIRKLEIAPDEITVDDIVYSVSRNSSSIFFMLMRMVSQTCGEDVAVDFARRFGYTVGRSNYRKQQQRFGVTTLGLERLAMYEDTVHLLGGSDMAYCFSEYNEQMCVIRRTRCAFHTGAPEDAAHYCPFLNEGFERAYRESDPELEMEYPKSLARGDEYCEHVFRYRDDGGKSEA